MTAVVAEGLSKRYRIGEYRAGYQTLRDTLAHAARRTLHREQVDHSLEDLWALKDVSFTVTEGEVVGVIGRNGAGKSTLLKILSRITSPTEGRVDPRPGGEPARGRHRLPPRADRPREHVPERRDPRDEAARDPGEVRRDRRVRGIEKFIDTPVKRYSSGMYVRLAFAVAAHLEPEILIIDEVLAVGDSEFQQRCIGRMEDISSSGGRCSSSLTT